jgi:hypothetical protein
MDNNLEGGDLVLVTSGHKRVLGDTQEAANKPLVRPMLKLSTLKVKVLEPYIGPTLATRRIPAKCRN